MDAMNIEEEETFAVNDPIKLTDTRVKKPVAQVGGYEYKFNHAAKTTGRFYWRCTKNGTLKFRAVIYTDEATDGSPVTEI
uniref:FLYWCH-type domain-containing protein n=1 Tax=Panagrolaimus davidi TaxID=227884 RepID=A0A914QW18_9BILA